MRRISRAIPSDPRCKLCDTPFGRPGNVLRFLGFGPSRINRRICSGCIHALKKRPGGAEVEATFLFADVRGSTALAESVGAEEFRGLMARFYAEAAAAVDVRNGIVDKFAGDELVALFIPGFAGPDHAANAVEAARDLLVSNRPRGRRALASRGRRRARRLGLHRDSRRRRGARLHGARRSRQRGRAPCRGCERRRDPRISDRGGGGRSGHRLASRRAAWIYAAGRKPLKP